MRLFSWGANSHGQLGQGFQSEQNAVPSEVDVPGTIKSVVGGGKHTIIVLLSGNILSCGDNESRQLGRDTIKNTQFIFQPVPCQISITKVACGWDFNLALSDDLNVYGWGSNSFGQLGFPRKYRKIVASAEIIFKAGLCIGAGLRHSVIVGVDGSVFTAGSGRKGQLGIVLNKETPTFLDNFTQVLNILNICKVSCGESYCIVLSEDHKIFAWGDNRFGQLGINPEVHISISLPVSVSLPTSSPVKDIFCGWTHSVAITENGAVLNWGRNNYGQLGEFRKHNWKPEILRSIDKIKEVAIGSQHNLAFTESNTILSWGWNEHGNCGNESVEDVHRPVSVLFEKGLKPLLVGTGSAHSFVCGE